MKLIYLTSQKYPSKKADPSFWKAMAEAFNEILGHDFLFLVRGESPKELEHVHTNSIASPKRFRMLFYFLQLPVLIFSRGWNNRETVFFCTDPYLSPSLIFWRKVLRFRYRICSDWHQLFDDWKDKYIARNSDYLIATSRRLKGLLVSNCGIDPNKIEVAYGGVDTAPFLKKAEIKKEELRTQLALPQDSFLVGYVGGFRSVGMEKGLDMMIKALPYLNEKIRMVFVGGSEKQIDEYKVLATGLNVEHRCIFVEKQKPFEKVVEYMSAMDILVIPYPDKHHFRDYGFPMKVWEYMASGRPIVYSDLEIIGEILRGRGTPFQPDSPSSLAATVMTVLDDSAAAEARAAQNTKEVRAYSWRARAEHILTFIQT